jgi:hypothetical protein
LNESRKKWGVKIRTFRKPVTRIFPEIKHKMPARISVPLSPRSNIDSDTTYGFKAEDAVLKYISGAVA